MSKILKLIVLVVLIGIFTVGCNNILPTKMPIDDSLKEILNSKDENYNFLEDEEFLEMVNDYANSIPNIDKDVQYEVGILNDKDNIPELVVFMDSNPDDVNAGTELVVYEFNGDSYVIADRVGMNHDSSSHLLEIGNVSEDQKGIFVSNNVGAHSSVTYGFILEDGKLKSILNENKVSLMSIYAENEIKDIDQDGILEFSIYTINPETGMDTSEKQSDMMSIWYKWDGYDGANAIMAETSNTSANALSTKNVSEKYYGMKINDVLSQLDENLENFTPSETTSILKDYILRLEENYPKVNQSPNLSKLVEEREIYDLSVDRLNNLSYVSRDNALDKDVRKFLVENLELGYKLVEAEGQFYFIVDNQMFIDEYEPYISRLFYNYLNIKAFNSNEPYLKDGSLAIDRDSLAERIVAIENYRLRFPYSSFIPELNSIYKEYVRTFILGSVNSPNYNTKTNIFSDGSIAVFKNISNNYSKTHFADVLNFVIDELEDNLNMFSIELKEDIEKII